MAGRTIAIGDIHGCADALAGLIDAIAPTSEDTLITLGDQIDRGPQSRQVIDRLLELAERCRVISLQGNHEELLLDAFEDLSKLRRWLNCGGTETLRSYGWVYGGPKRTLASWFPETHQQFLMNCRSYHETATHLFVHASVLPDLSMEEQPPEALRWRLTNRQTAKQHCSGKVTIVGHTRQVSGEVLDLGFLICIDTNCARGGWLTALDVESGQIWQADAGGKLRA